MKTKILVLTICFFSFAIYTYGQTETEIGAFAAIPIGALGSTNLDDDGGFADTGWGIRAYSKRKWKFLPDGMSVGFFSTYQWSNLNNGELSKAYTEKLGQRTEVTDSRYAPFTTALGPNYEWEFGKFSLDVRAHIGIMFLNTKSFTINVFDDQGTQTLSETVNFDNDPAFLYGGGLKFGYEFVPDLLGVALTADFIHAKQKVDVSFESVDALGSSQNLSFMNVGISFIIKPIPEKSE